MNVNNEPLQYTFNKVQEILVHSCSGPATRQKEKSPLYCHITYHFQASNFALSICTVVYKLLRVLSRRPVVLHSPYILFCVTL